MAVGQNLLDKAQQTISNSPKKDKNNIAEGKKAPLRKTSISYKANPSLSQIMNKNKNLFFKNGK
ncbi:MAG: hypothetical protein ACQKHC_00910 [Candidatus Phytoplasma pruni]